jgi:hypothetical protein
MAKPPYYVTGEGLCSRSWMLFRKSRISAFFHILYQRLLGISTRNKNISGII